MQVTGVELIDLPEEIPVYDVTAPKHHNFRLANGAFVHNSHIECLLLGHLLKHARPLMERGHIYLAQPPLYRVVEGRKKPTYLKGEAELGAFYASRAAGVSAALVVPEGSPQQPRAVAAATRAIAERASSVRRAVEAISRAGGQLAEDVSHAMPCVFGMDAEGGVAGLAEAVLARRELDGCEQVTGVEVTDGTFVISGLAPTGRFFTTVVDEAFYNCAADCWNAVEEMLGKSAEVAASATRFRLGDRETPFDFLQASSALEAEARRGTTITRMKGLGEMEAPELGETTLAQATRTLIQVTSADFDEAGTFVGSMLSSSTVEARREIVRSTLVSREEIDA